MTEGKLFEAIRDNANQNNEDAALLELRGLLLAVLGSNVPELADLRRIDEIRRNGGQREDLDFYPMRAAVSDLDTVPDESRRHLFSSLFLREKDAECALYLSKAAEEIKGCAESLLGSSWMSATSRRGHVAAQE